MHETVMPPQPPRYRYTNLPLHLTLTIMTLGFWGLFVWSWLALRNRNRNIREKKAYGERIRRYDAAMRASRERERHEHQQRIEDARRASPGDEDGRAGPDLDPWATIQMRALPAPLPPPDPGAAPAT